MWKTYTYDMRTVVTVPPQCLPVTLLEAKAQLRLTSNSEDVYIQSLIGVATDMMELYLHRALILRTITGYLDFPSLYARWFPGTVVTVVMAMNGLQMIEFPLTPTASVTSVELYNLDNVPTVVPPTVYQLDTTDPNRPARLALRFGQIWPLQACRVLDAFKTVFVAGYTPAGPGPVYTDAELQAAVPPAIKMAILQLISFLYNNRGDCSGAGPDGACGACGATFIAGQYRIINL